MKKKQTQQEQLNVQEKQHGAQESQEMFDAAQEHASQSQRSEAKPWSEVVKQLEMMAEKAGVDLNAQESPFAAQLSIQLDAARLRILDLKNALGNIYALLATSKLIDYKRDCFDAMKIAQAALNK